MIYLRIFLSGSKFFTLHSLLFTLLCHERDSNPHNPFRSRDFKSLVSTNSTIMARLSMCKGTSISRNCQIFYQLLISFVKNQHLQGPFCRFLIIESQNLLALSIIFSNFANRKQAIMDAKRILKFLRQLMANNNRPWFQEHRQEYEAVRADFEQGIEQALRRIMTFDDSIAHLTVKDCTYRFYRDTRFSNDKSPYKNHLGAYISAHGKKSLHGGYYIHLEPGHCMVACGNYWLPTNILT